MLRALLISVISLLIVAAALSLSGCGDIDAADELTAESEQLRISATDKFRRSTASIDAMIRTVDSGSSLGLDQIEVAAQTAISQYDSAVAELNTRGETIDEASTLDLNDNYREYLRLIASSNEKLTLAITAAAEIPELILQEKQSFAGWDDIKAREVVGTVELMEQQVERLYAESETLRNRAQAIREDNPGDF